MINLLKTKTAVLRIITMMGFILPVIAPMDSWAVAKNDVHHFSSANAVYTTDFGIENPEGMVYFPGSEAFVVWGMDKSESMINPGKETSRKTNFAQHIANPLGASFDGYSNSLFTLGAGNKDLHKIKVDERNAQPLLNDSGFFNVESLALDQVQGMTFNPATGQFFALDANKQDLLVLSPHPAEGFNAVNTGGNPVKRISLASLSQSRLRGLAFNPNNNHLYVGDPGNQTVYELTEAGEWISTYDISNIHLENPSVMLFAPSQDTTDAPDIVALYILDSGQPMQAGADSTSDPRATAQKGQIVELSLQAPAALPAGTPLLPSTLVRTFSTSNTAWNPSSPDPAGVDYWPLLGRLLIADSEVDEMAMYFQGKNVFLSTTAGALTGTCSTTSFTGEPTGVAINPFNNHIFFSTDFNDTIFEVGLGADGVYCTADDTRVATNVSSLYRITDAEDVAYGGNTLFIGGGDSAEVYKIPLGPNGVLGGGDDGAMTHFDTASLGFSDMEALGYNSTANTLFIASPKPTERYLGEVTTSGTLLRAYDLSFMGSAGNIRSDVAYAPASQNPATKNIYIVSRGIDNDDNRSENDGKVWEVQLSNVVVPTPTNVVVPTPTSGTSGGAQVTVNIGGNNIRNYNIPSGASISSDYNINSGPVHVTSTNNRSIFTSQRSVFGSSFNSIIGYPGNQLTTEYWFTSYDGVGMTTYLVIGNPHPSNTAIVDVYIGGVKRNTTSYSIGPGQRIFDQFRVNSGPVRVVSTNNVNIFVSERTRFGNSFNEVMGYPADQFATEYWFTSYDDVGMTTYLVIGNPSTSQTANVDVYIGGVKRNTNGPYRIGPGQRVFPRFGINSGPVRVVSTNGVDIFASERTRFGDTFNEVMGYPVNQAHTEFWFTSYDDRSMITYLIIGNPSTSQTANVDVYIGGVKRNTSPIQIAPGQRFFQRYNINGGPVHIVSTNGVDIFASERSRYLQSFNEVLGIADNRLTTDYWYTSYDDVGMTTFLVIGAP